MSKGRKKPAKGTAAPLDSGRSSSTAPKREPESRRLLRRWLTLGTLASLVGISAIVSSTKDGFDFARDYVFAASSNEGPQVRHGKPAHIPATGDHSDDGTTAESADIGESLPASETTARSIDELIDLLEHRSGYIAPAIDDLQAREKFLSLHGKNIGALRKGQLVLAHEITAQIHEIVSNNIRADYAYETSGASEGMEIAAESIEDSSVYAARLYPAPRLPDNR